MKNSAVPGNNCHEAIVPVCLQISFPVPTVTQQAPASEAKSSRICLRRFCVAVVGAFPVQHCRNFKLLRQSQSGLPPPHAQIVPTFVYRCEKWSFAETPGSQHLWAWNGTFVWRLAAAKGNGAVSVFDGNTELIEYATGTLRERVVAPVSAGDNADWTRATAEFVKRPRQVVLDNAGEALVYANNWRLIRRVAPVYARRFWYKGFTSTWKLISIRTRGLQAAQWHHFRVQRRCGQQVDLQRRNRRSRPEACEGRESAVQYHAG